MEQVMKVVYPSIAKYDLSLTKTPRETMQSGVGGAAPKALGTVNHEKVLIKGYDDYEREVLAEFFAYNLGTALGIAVNKVKVIDSGVLLGLRNLCSVHWWEDDFITRADYNHRNLDEEQDQTIYFFDRVIANGDRHSHNYGFLKNNNELFLIDHGFSSPWSKWTHYDDGKVKNFFDKPHCLPLVDKFISLTEEDFRKMVEFPKDIQHNIHEDYFEEIVDRMLRFKEEFKKKMN